MPRWLDQLPEWVLLTLGVMGFFALIALGVIGACIVIFWELCMPAARPAESPSPTEETL